MRARMKSPFSLSNPLPWGVFLAGLLLLAALGWWFQRPVAPAVATRIETLARDSGSPQIWQMYLAAKRRGIRERDVQRIEEAAKAAEPPYGLIRGAEPADSPP